ncbi:MAG: hypothetical protein C0417_05875 [Chlorobiaceae bacterium]|nr:hypothetical protein [Chlorobiaceae bacterium]
MERKKLDLEEFLVFVEGNNVGSSEYMRILNFKPNFFYLPEEFHGEIYEYFLKTQTFGMTETTSQKDFHAIQVAPEFYKTFLDYI